MEKSKLHRTGLNTLETRSEYLADYLDALELSLDPEVLKSINESQEEIARGEYELWSRSSERASR